MQLSSPLVALLSLLRMKYCGRPSSALLLSPVGWVGYSWG
jgi:hypothetical protein